MPPTITTEELQQLVETGDPQLVEVLPAADYDLEHLPGAINIPITDMTAQSVARLDRRRPVVTYCFDYQCDLSARAAARLASLGFDDVRDYRASKAAWFAAGLPAEGSTQPNARAGTVARPLPTCGPNESVGDVAGRFDERGLVAVVDGDDVVLGLLREETAGLPTDTPVETAMQPGPVSVRPSITIEELARSMAQDRRPFVLVTTQGGRLIGVIEADALHGQP